MLLYHHVVNNLVHAWVPLEFVVNSIFNYLQFPCWKASWKLCFSYQAQCVKSQSSLSFHVIKEFSIRLRYFLHMLMTFVYFQIMDKDSSSNLNDVFLQYSEYMENEQSLREVRIELLNFKCIFKFILGERRCSFSYTTILAFRFLHLDGKLNSF